MRKIIELLVPPEELYNQDYYYSAASYKLKALKSSINAVVQLKRSVDARIRGVVYKVLVEVYINESPQEEKFPFTYKPVKSNKKVLIIGSGPAGLFAALRLIELGIKPVIFERGKDHQSRRKDLREIQQHDNVNPDSNYCFGEGGAGTYSDGKLHTRSTKRGDIKKILKIFVYHGAKPEILIDSHPHIGSNKLPDIIGKIRETIIENGGEVNFNSRVTDIIIKDSAIKGVVINNNQEFEGEAVILAAGHSARDMFDLLHSKGIQLEPKPFALGVRIEHPQDLINKVFYNVEEKHPNLPNASYSVTCSLDNRGVYSFCMCPGGIIIPGASAPGEVVINGMSLAKRDSPFANSGIVVSLLETDFDPADYPFGGLKFQQNVEQLCFKLANNTLKAPAQRLTDFVEGRLSATLPKTSYIPGLTSAPLHSELPGFISTALREAFLVFNKKVQGYYTEEAQIIATESRTSSPVRIPRIKETYMHPQISGLFPSGEGAGHAGGIMSAAMDGENCADASVMFLNRIAV
jgi:uncharacterized protein